MYLGMLMFVSGLALCLDSPYPWIVVLAFFLLIRQRFILKEEVLMAETFGEAYLTYRARVGRWFSLKSGSVSV